MVVWTAIGLSALPTVRIECAVPPDDPGMVPLGDAMLA